MYERFTDRARKVMQLANQEAQRFNHDFIGSEHVLLGLVKSPNTATEILEVLGAECRKLRLEVEKRVTSDTADTHRGRLPLTPRAKKVLEYAMEESRELNDGYVGTEHMLLGLLRDQGGKAQEVLTNADVSHRKLRLLLTARPKDKKRADERMPASQTRPSLRKSPALNEHGTLLASKDPWPACPHREEELRKLQVILHRQHRHNVLLVSDDSIGVRWLLESLALQLRDQAQGIHTIKHLIEVNLSRVWGTRQGADVIQAMLLESVRAREVAVVFRRIDLLLHSRGLGPLDQRLLTSTLSTTPARIIATTTINIHQQLTQMDSPILDGFVPVIVSGAASEKAVEMLRVFAQDQAERLGIQIPTEFMDDIIALAEAFLDNQSQPGAGIDILDHAASIASLRVAGSVPGRAEHEANEQRLQQAKEDAIAAADFELAASYRDEIEANRLAWQQELQKRREYEGACLSQADIIQAISDLADVDRSRVEDALRKP